MRRMLLSVVLLGIITIAMMGGAAWYLTSSNPRVKLKGDIERALPVSIESFVEQEDAATRRRRLEIHAVRVDTAKWRRRASDGGVDEKALVHAASLAPAELAREVARVGADSVAKGIDHRSGTSLIESTAVAIDDVVVHLEGAAPATVTVAHARQRAFLEQELGALATRLVRPRGAARSTAGPPVPAPKLTIVDDEKVSEAFCLVVELPPAPVDAPPLTDEALKEYARTALDAAWEYSSVRIVGPRVPPPGHYLVRRP